MGVVSGFLESSHEITYVWYQNIKRWENYIIPVLRNFPTVGSPKLWF